MRRTFLFSTGFPLVLALAITIAQAQDTTQPADQTQAQDQNQSQDQGQGQSKDQKLTTFHVNVAARNTQAVNWHHASGTTRVDITGTSLMPAIRGQARVRSEAGRIRVDTEIKGFGDPQQFGKEYLTYVLFAITPEGRAQNLGEIIRDKNGKTSTQTFTTDLQTFGLIITAEPYFAVTQPSDLVVAENIIRKDTVGATEPINVHYELVGRGGYIAAPAAYHPLIIDEKLPFDLYQAQNAVRIAADNDADKYAPDAFKRANDLLIQAQEYASRKKVQSKPVITVARQAVQQAQDALILTLRRKDAERLANERAAAAERTRKAQEEAATASQQAAADAAARAQADAQRKAAELAAQQADLNRQRAEEQQHLAAAAAQQAEEQRRAAEQAAQQAQADKEALRHKLLEQFNAVLSTRDTPRGLVANLSDVLFATNSFQLRQNAQIALAKFAGIVQAYPGLHLQIEGHTDSTGTEAYNQRLSEKRANSVRDFLTTQGVSPDTTTAAGMGQNDPVAPNTTAAGRQQNRRVEIVVSGDVIGQPIGSTSPTVPTTPSNPQ